MFHQRKLVEVYSIFRLEKTLKYNFEYPGFLCWTPPFDTKILKVCPRFSKKDVQIVKIQPFSHIKTKSNVHCTKMLFLTKTQVDLPP